VLNKQSTEYVLREVDKLYQKKFEDHETDAIEKHIAFIVDFLHACGWTEEEYMEAFTRSQQGLPAETPAVVN
jgi:hypothetical protein